MNGFKQSWLEDSFPVLPGTTDSLCMMRIRGKDFKTERPLVRDIAAQGCQFWWVCFWKKLNARELRIKQLTWCLLGMCYLACWMTWNFYIFPSGWNGQWLLGNAKDKMGSLCWEAVFNSSYFSFWTCRMAVGICFWPYAECVHHSLMKLGVSSSI